MTFSKCNYCGYELSWGDICQACAKESLVSTSLFVRSYPPDFQWLKYSIASMKKYLIGVDKKVLVVPWKTQLPEEIESFFDIVVESYLYEKMDGYVAQQFDKLDAYKYVDSDYILYSDSDCIYTGPFNVDNMFSGFRPVLGMTPYVNLDGDVLTWKRVTEKLLGFEVSHEYMRCFPLLHRKDTVREFSLVYPELYKRVQGREVSEFNLLGAFAFKEDHPYHFTEDVPRYPCHQFWSWSGLTEEEKKTIEEYIR